MKLKDKKSQHGGRSAYAISDEAGIVAMPNMFDSFAGVFSPLIDSQLRNMSSRAGVRARGVSSFDFKGAALLATKVSGMNSSMLRSRGSYSSPATDGTMFRGDGKYEFRLEIDHIVPIKDDSRKGIFDSDSKVGKEDDGSLNAGVDREAQENHDCCEGNICPCGVIAIGECCVEHAGAEDVTKNCVDECASSAKDLGVTAILKKSSIGVIAHE